MYSKFIKEMKYLYSIILKDSIYKLNRIHIGSRTSYMIGQKIRCLAVFKVNCVFLVY